jgi:gliding motility-associated lipoprotein GldH
MLQFPKENHRHLSLPIPLQKPLNGFHQESIKDQVVRKKEMTKIYQASLLGLVLMLFSCGKERMFEEYHSFDSDSWQETDSIYFDLSNLDSVRGNAIVGIRYTEDYPFSNCYLKMIVRDSSAVVLMDSLVNVPVFDRQTGKPIGQGFGNTFTTYDTLPFAIPQKAAEVIFLQYMRQAELEGIEAVGLKVLKP